MIKVAAKNRFSQKLTHKSKKNQNKVHENETNLGIFVNGKNFNNFIDPSSSEKSCQNDKETVNNPHIRNSALNFSKISDESDLKEIKHRKNLSMKSPIRMSKLYLNRNSHTVEFEKSSNEGLDTIKIDSSKIEENSKCGRKSKTEETNRVSARSSAVKKISSFLKKSEKKKSSVLTKKVSIFKQNFTNVVNESERYEEFLKEPSLEEKRKSKEIANEVYKYCEKENRFLLTECPSKSYFERESFVKFQDDSKNTLKRKSRVSKDYFIVKSPKEFRMSTNERQSVKNDVQDGTQLFKSFAEDSNKENEVEQRNRRSSETEEMDESSEENFSNKEEETLKAEKDRIIHEMKEKEKTEELFRKLLRELESEKEMQKFQKQSQNFYEDLRVKMLKKYDMMMKDYRLDDKEKDKISLLIEGCNLEKHRRVSNFATEKLEISQRRRPDTAKAIREASKDIYLLNYVDKKRNPLRTRPSSCNPKINRQNSNVRPFDQSSCFMPVFTTNNEHLHNNRCNSNVFSTDQSKSEYDEFFSITNPDIKTVSMIQNNIEIKDEIISSKNELSSSSSNLTLIKKKSNKKLIQEKSILSTKFNILMDICDGESVEHIETKKKMKVFEYYCSKVDNGFQKITEKINNFVSNF